MAKAYAKPFYNSQAWRIVREGYMDSQDWICERCGSPAEIVHHKIHITPSNIDDPDITLSFDNLEALCWPCHTREHNETGVTVGGVYFDEDGELVEVRPMDEQGSYLHR